MAAARRVAGIVVCAMAFWQGGKEGAKGKENMKGYEEEKMRESRDKKTEMAQS